MKKKLIACALACGLLLLSAGCKRIQEPWVRSPEQLAQERSRPAAVRMELRCRFLGIQTDR
jgi:hypothetical protein